MTATLPKAPALLAGLAGGLLVAAPLLADDTELYVSGAALAEKPNVLFLLDNSGSMDSTLQAPRPYDATQTYTGDFDPAYIYWSADSNIPQDPTSTARFALADNQCQASQTSLNNFGIYTDRAAAWRNDGSNVWSLISGVDSGSMLIECRADMGVHGSDASAGAYPIDGTLGPWGAVAAEAIDWDNRGTNYSFYSANFLNYKANPTLQWRTRLQVLRDVVGELALRLSDVNIGLMWFSDANPDFTSLESVHQGGYVAHAMSDIDVPANRAAFINALLDPNIPADTNTPLSETLFEAYQYYSGGAVTFGVKDGVSVAAARDPANPANYVSPIVGECQSNAIVLMTDGLPTRDNEADTMIEALPNFPAITGNAECLDEHSSWASFWDGRCLDELAQVMNAETTDLSPTLPDKQRVQTYTIGFQIDSGLLQATSEKGGGAHFNSANAEELSAAFASILEDIDNVPRTFTAPGVSVDGFSRLVNRDSLYFTMFAPSFRPHWEGNLKKYRLAFDANGQAYITDSDEANNPGVIDPVASEFIDSARSYWSTSVDGNEILQGGVRDKLTDTHLLSRQVWTDLDSSLPLNSSANQLHEDNTALTSALLGIPGATEAYRTRLVQWARGVNVQQLMVNGSVTNSRHSVADPLHSPPVLVQYGGTEAAPKLLVFFTTNDGYLHAIDEATGEEVFAFVPQDLLARLPLLYQNIGTSQRPYGLDGTISVEITDINRNGIIEPSADGVTSGDRVVLYFGQRRGGSNLYALDVTNAAQATPSAKLLWTIRGGVTPAAGDLTGYEELGQTWSQPLPRSIRLNGVERRVVVFGGGYDTNQDSTTAVDSKGRGIFIADAETGERLWAAGNFAGADLLLSDMTYSIPSRLAAFDVDSDDLLDRIYVGDMGGQVWRIDLSPDNSNAATLATGGRIAALSGALETDHRRFYYPPDVALITDISGSYLALVMGSGYRAHPLDETFNDRIYMLRDYAVYDAPASHTALTEADLFDATDNTIGEGTALERAAAVAELDASRGWYIRLPTGEKSLSGALIVNGVALVPSFTPNSVNSADYDPCGPRSGVGAVYYLRVVNATPVYNFDGQGTDTALTLGDRKLTLNTPGIPPETAFIVTEQDGEVINAVLHGKEAGEDPSANNAVRTYWYEQ